MKKTSTFSEKKSYQKPLLMPISIDNNISLFMASTTPPPGDPESAPQEEYESDNSSSLWKSFE